jgi:hypothetical protein
MLQNHYKLYLHLEQIPHIAGPPFAASHAANACAFLVCMKTVPGPVNLHTSPSPECMFDNKPPEATRSRTYLQFHATRCPLSMMYFSFSWSYTIQISTQHHIKISQERHLHLSG